jgi:hypothetical protein
MSRLDDSGGRSDATVAGTAASVRASTRMDTPSS